ncbi:hypothetical protein [Loktanella sp. 5RATIMAR09]|uniref:hypothetical protein n=1 Tax=Loktanella sp. 5RATIMAR09 TaxID=1225655 RepID=UPI00336BDD52
MLLFARLRRLIKAAFTLSVDAVGMHHAILPLSPEAWFRHLFSAQSARDGGVVRRKVRDMERMVGRDVFTA